jgi:hypothetical protein
MTALSQVIARLDAASHGEIPAEMLKELAKTARPIAPAVRAAILNIPVKGLVPYKQPPGLRVRIARCVVTWADLDGPVVRVGVGIDPRRMPSGQYSLPLMMDGEKVWRHPVFGNQANIVVQEPHPYFWDAVSSWGPATTRAVQRVADRIAAQINA